MPSSQPEITAEQFLAELGQLRESRQSESESTDDARSGYLRAAAVLADFDLASLRPADSGEGRGGAVELGENLVLAHSDPALSRWTLRPDVRRQVLSQMSVAEMLSALEANAEHSETPTQAVLESCIRGTLPPVSDLSVEGLEDLLQVSRWLEGIVEGIPPAEEIQARLARRRLLAGFELLVGEHFAGRTKEIARLRDHVEMYAPSSAREALARQIRRWRGAMVKPPLLILGPGGVGKSTLIAKFILEHAQLGGELQIPFAYLDFDRPSLSAEDPATLVLEAVRHLRIQYSGPSTNERFLELEASCQTELQRRSIDEERVRGKASYGSDLLDQRTVRTAQASRELSLVEMFAGLVRDLPLLDGSMRTVSSPPAVPPEHPRPFLLVLDTFEEALYRTPTALRRLWSWISSLQTLHPMTRVVISGRVGLPSRTDAPNWKVLELKHLDLKAAIKVLAARGIPNQLAAAVARQVGGNPLTLHLAAEVAQQKDEVGPRGIRGLRTSFLFFSRGEARIQGELYARVLNHIHDDDVRRLAHPGLALRRVTPEVIRQVMAEPCQVDVPDEATAESLFERFRREVALVAEEADGSLRYRNDVRRAMLDLLAHDKPAELAAIQRNAVEYYQRKSGVEARAEEIYHRLQLGQDSSEVDPRWLEGVEPFLSPAMEELPPGSRAYLAAKLGISLPPDLVGEETDLPTWEVLVAQQVPELLAEGFTAEALDLLRQREARTPGSPLWALEATALDLLGKDAEARKIVARGITAAAGEEAFPALLALLRVAAEQAVADGDPQTAARRLEEAEDIARRIGEDRALQEILSRRLVLLRTLEETDVDEVQAVEGELLERFIETSEEVMTEDPDLMKRIVSVLGREHDEVLKRSLSAMRIRPSGPRDHAELAQALSQGLVTPEGFGELGESIILSYARTLGIDTSAGLTTDVIFAILESAADTGRLEEFLQRLLETGETDEDVRSAVADLIDDRPAEER